MPLQSLNLRAALFRCLNELKKNETLGKDVMLRKTMFDDCKGDKVQDLLASFSTIVLRKVLAEGDGGKASIAGRLAIAKRVTKKEHESFLPLAIAHRSCLTALLQRKRELRARYQGFDRILDSKEKGLDQRFEAIEKTQGFLDANSIPDHTVARVSKIVQKQWQGDARLVDVIAEGEEHKSWDRLLDQSFSEIWSRVSAGTFDGPTEFSHHGILEDLEKRVADQEARLKQWKDFREAMKRKAKPYQNAMMQSPSLTRHSGFNPDLQKQRDLVFSPRKSPRKSDLKMEEEKSPTVRRVESQYPDPQQYSDLNSRPGKRLQANDSDIDEAPKQEDPSSEGGFRNGDTPVSKMSLSSYVGTAGANNKDPKKKGRSHWSVSPYNTSLDDNDQSGFSEISNGHLHYTGNADDAAFNNDLSDRGQNSNKTHQHNGSNISSPPDECTRQLNGTNNTAKNECLNKDDLLAEQIITMTLNAAPTPAKPKPSLLERTRQSILSTNSSSPLKAGPQFTSIACPPSPSQPPTPLPPPSPNPSNPPGTLLERTRHSISHLPSRPPRKSITQDRRISKANFPRNPFETPKKQMPRIKEFETPPGELFSPGAGYDSVFKSRPKVGFSPVASPVFGGEGGEEEILGREDG